ncbi:hypothetical protein MF672_041725 [Actinomadura sp. ATCC 31491]|uniref:Uncharacterized protein n=1 Tax=Actinomadura luzonensis TaxID=2805427 RepID=A0ABT0G843_9ACTN|nr:hypothetical protein [Actinomadura luzonensis]MCK2220276.1 hypothetical protein [Actinomadura luzonensis]
MERSGIDTGIGHVSCTPAPADQLFEIAVLDLSDGDGQGHWHTIGWGVDRREADSIAESFVTRPLHPYEAARIRHNGHLVGEHRRRPD